MRNQKVLFVFLFSFLSSGWDWDNFSIKKEVHPPIKIQAVWVVNTAKEKILKPQFVNNSSPIITEDLVVQGNFISGIKAYKKDLGKLHWNFKINSGVASPVVLHKGNLYFGGADGFFYSLQLKTGQLNWKFFTGSENMGAPHIHEDRIYWTANNQKLYAFSLKGKQLWIYSGSSLSEDFVVRGRPRPAVHENLLYVAFYPGRLLALDKSSGKLKWELELSSSHSIKEDLAVRGNCLFVPVFDFYLFCLKPLNGDILWKKRGGAASSLFGNSVIYQFYKNKFYALKQFDGLSIWEQEIKADAIPLSPVVFKDYLVYGFPSKGKLIFASVKDGQNSYRV